MPDIQDHEDRLKGAEAKIKMLQWVGLPFVGLALFNLGVTLWYFQQKSEPDWNFISVTLTIFEVLLAIALIGGFWMLRSAAEQAAAKEARQVATRAAEEAARKSLLQWMELLEDIKNDTDGEDSDLTNMMNSMGN